MASSVNRRTAERGRFLSLPSRYNRTAVDRLAYGCMGLSPNGVSVSLHPTLIQGSAATARRPRRLWEECPTPEKLIRTPRRPFQTAGTAAHGVPVRLWLGGRAAPRRTVNTVLSWLVATGSRAGGASQQRGPGLRRQRGSGTRSPQPSHAQDARPSLAPVRPTAPRHGPVVPASGR